MMHSHRQAPHGAVTRGLEGLVTFGCLVLGGCLGADEASDSAVSRVQAELIGGFDADSPRLNAVGSLSRLYPAPADSPESPLNLSLACTGALLDDSTIVTAKHCGSTFASAARSGATLVFGLGADGNQPTAYATVIDVENAPGDDAGFTGNGHDVAVMHLQHPLPEAPTLKLGALEASHLGQGFAGIGYGQADNGGGDESRRIGGLTLRALEGRTYELLFGSFEAYFKARHGAPVPAECIDPTPEAADSDVCRVVASDRETYETTQLEQAGEALVSGADGGSQPCYGDSGGPLLRANEAGELVAYGVVSGGVSSDQLQCDFGAIYARFTPEVLSFLQQAMTWKDPCERVPMSGMCEGDVVRRCATPAEGRRRVLELDCATVGLHCIDSPQGAGCREN